jgi:hypothetical protein
MCLHVFICIFKNALMYAVRMCVCERERFIPFRIHVYISMYIYMSIRKFDQLKFDQLTFTQASKHTYKQEGVGTQRPRDNNTEYTYMYIYYDIELPAISVLGTAIIEVFADRVQVRVCVCVCA